MFSGHVQVIIKLLPTRLNSDNRIVDLHHWPRRATNASNYKADHSNTALMTADELWWNEPHVFHDNERGLCFLESWNKEDKKPKVRKPSCIKRKRERENAFSFTSKYITQITSKKCFTNKSTRSHTYQVANNIYEQRLGYLHHAHSIHESSLHCQPRPWNKMKITSHQSSLNCMKNK